MDLRAFLPPHLGRELAHRPETFRGAVAYRAALLFTDIAGFTSLTERLQARGRGGAEEVAELVNRAFRPAIGAIERRGGSIVSFGGDALFSLFRGAGAVSRAREAAAAIRRGRSVTRPMETSSGTATLEVAQAIHWGRVTALHLGEGDRRCHLVTGPSVMALARLAGRARASEVLLSSVARRRLATEGGGRAVTAPVPLADARARRYLPHALLPLLGGFEGAFRRVATLFLETRGASIASHDAFFRCLDEILEALDGVLLKTDISMAGTKWMCVFGIPTAQEDAADRAARAALELRVALPRGLVHRGGIHAGIVVNVEIGTRTRRSFDVMGDAVNTAARVTGRACWGEVWATASTRAEMHETSTRFAGCHALAGKVGRHALYSLHAGRPAARRILERDLPLEGRRSERRFLARALERAAAGRGSVITLAGSAGVGKSRLADAVIQRARTRGFHVAAGRPLPFSGAPYWVVGDVLRDALGIGAVSTATVVRRVLRRAARQLGLEAVDRDHLAEILGVRMPGSALSQLSARAIRINNDVALAAFIGARGARHPQLLVIEDAHRADGPSLGALAHLAAGIAERSVLVLLLTRSAASPVTGGTMLELGPLEPPAARRIVRRLLPRAPRRVTRELLERAGGNPLFVLELARHVRDRAGSDLPPTIESIFAARLDRLPMAARRTAQASAVLGRTFSLPVVRRLEPGRGIEDSIQQLVAAHVVIETRRVPFAEYAFCDALFRDVAYESVLESRRRVLHGATARALERLHARDLDGQLAVLAHHWDRAGQASAARRYYLDAARQAESAWALPEALALLDRLLELAGPSRERLAASVLRGWVLHQMGKNAVAETALRDAVDGARRLGDPALEAGALNRLAQMLENTGRLEAALRLLARGDVLARRSSIPGVRVSTLTSIARIQGSLGLHAEAERRLRRALRLVRQGGSGADEALVLGNLAVLAFHAERHEDARRLSAQAVHVWREMGKPASHADLNTLAGALYRLGDVPGARRNLEDAVSSARRIGDRRSEGRLLSNLALLGKERGDFAEAERYGRRSLLLAQQLGDAVWESKGVVALAEVLERQGRVEEAIALFAPAARRLRALGRPRGLDDLARAWATLELGLPSGRGRRARLELLQATLPARDPLHDAIVRLVASRATPAAPPSSGTGSPS